MSVVTHVALVTVLAVLLSSCASRPRPLAQEAAEGRVPAIADRSKSSGVVDDAASWSRDFGDPRLTALIETTLAENPDVASAAARLRAAAATVRIVGADRLPRVSAEAGASRARTVNKVDFPGVGETVQTRTGNRFEIGLRMSWEIDLWGRLADARQAALFDEEAAAAGFDGTRLALGASVARAWFQATALSLQTELAVKQLEVAEKSLRATEDRVNRGLLGSLELSLARSQVEAAEADVQSATRARRNAVRLLQTLSGRYPDGRFAVADDLPELETPPPANLPSTVLARRPDLRAAAADISAADSRVSQAEKSLIPALSLSGGYGTASDDLSDLLDKDFTVWNLAGNLLQPLFQGGALRGEVERRDALLAVAIASFESTLLTAFREVEDALDSDAYLREAARRSFESADHAREAAAVGFERYQRGLIELLDVLELQNRAFEAYRRAIDLRLAALTNRIDLYAALGGGFDNPAAAPESP